MQCGHRHPSLKPNSSPELNWLLALQLGTSQHCLLRLEFPHCPVSLLPHPHPCAWNLPPTHTLGQKPWAPPESLGCHVFRPAGILHSPAKAPLPSRGDPGALRTSGSLCPPPRVSVRPSSHPASLRDSLRLLPWPVVSQFTSSPAAFPPFSATCPAPELCSLHHLPFQPHEMRGAPCAASKHSHFRTQL